MQRCCAAVACPICDQTSFFSSLRASSSARCSALTSMSYDAPTGRPNQLINQTTDQSSIQISSTWKTWEMLLSSSMKNRSRIVLRDRITSDLGRAVEAKEGHNHT